MPATKVNAMNGVNYDIKHFLINEYTKEMGHLKYLKGVNTDDMGCGDQDHHCDEMEASQLRMDALQIKYEVYVNLLKN